MEDSGNGREKINNEDDDKEIAPKSAWEKL